MKKTVLFLVAFLGLMYPFSVVSQTINQIDATDQSIHYADAVNEHYFSIYYEIRDDGAWITRVSRGQTGTEILNHDVVGNVTIPQQVQYIAGSTTHNISIVGIDSRAFYDCYRLESISLPSTLKYIGDEAFIRCGGMTVLNFPSNSTLETIGNKAFEGCSITTLTIPNTVTTIGERAFNGNIDLTTLTIGTGVTSIGNAAFRQCNSLTTVNFNATNCSYMGDPNNAIVTSALVGPVFAECHNFTTLNIGSNVHTIPAAAFAQCTGLTGTLTIPNSVTTIGKYAFANCYNYHTITIGTGVTSIGEWAFRGTSNVSQINFNATNCTTMGTSTYPAFTTCSLGNITFGDNVQTVPAYACKGMYGLTSVVIGNAVSSVGAYAFADISVLPRVQVKPATPPTCPTTAFNGTTRLNLVVPCNNTSYNSQSPWSAFPSIVQNCQQYTLTVNTGNSSMGTCSGGGTYNSGASVTIQATPYEGYQFVRWQDNSTDNPRSVTVNGNGTYTAYFQAAPIVYHNVTVTSNNTSQGSVIGGGQYAHGARAVIRAIPTNNNYVFSQWSDNSTDNPRYVYVTSDSSFTAHFSQTRSITAFSNFDDNGNHIGEVSGDGVYADGQVATLLATPYHGYHFSNWVFNNSNIGSQNPLTINVSSTTAGVYVAMFEANAQEQTYTITVTSDNTTMGTVSGGGTYNSGATATLTATPNSGYRFVRWNDNNTQNPRTVTVNANATFTAYFEANSNPPTQYTITVNSSNTSMGTVSGGGTYNSGATATLTATPNSGYRFVRWNDNSTQNPRTITVTANATFTAYFEANSSPEGPVDPNTCIITSFPYTMDFDGDIVCWGHYDNNGDGTSWEIYNSYGYNETKCAGISYAANADDWLYSPNITTPGTYKVSWKAKAYGDGYPESYIVYAIGNNNNQIFSETLTSTNFIDRSAQFTVTAGDTVYILFRYISDDKYAFFIDNIVISRQTSSIADASDNNISIRTDGLQLYINGADGQTVVVTDVTGRTIKASKSMHNTSIQLPNSGVYFVRVGDHLARKVVVVR